MNLNLILFCQSIYQKLKVLYLTCVFINNEEIIYETYFKFVIQHIFDI